MRIDKFFFFLIFTCSIFCQENLQKIKLNGSKKISYNNQEFMIPNISKGVYTEEENIYPYYFQKIPTNKLQILLKFTWPESRLLSVEQYYSNNSSIIIDYLKFRNVPQFFGPDSEKKFRLNKTLGPISNLPAYYSKAT